jgi:hypothetical protein
LSDWSEVCDWLIDDLTDNVSGLRPCIPHRYASWDPGRLQAEAGEKHLAVWPDPEGETVQPFTTAAHELIQSMIVLYWEGDFSEDERQVSDEEAAADLLDLHNAARARLYKWSNQVIGNTYKVWYTGARFPVSAGTRWFAIGVEVHRAQEFS